MPSGGLCAALTAQRVPARGGGEPWVRTALGRATWAEVGVGGSLPVLFVRRGCGPADS